MFPQPTPVIRPPRLRRLSLAVLGLLLVLLVLLGLQGPMLLLFPMWIFTWLFRQALSRPLARLPQAGGFLLAGIAYGMLTEIFAILTNLNLPPEQRILLDPNPRNDLVLGLLYYTSLILAWYLLLRRQAYSPREIFFLTGLYGIVVEESGGVLFRLFTQPLTGAPYALLVMLVYGLFPMLALQLTAGQFPPERPREKRLQRYALALFALFLQYALYGNTVYPLLKAWLGG